MFNRRSLIPSMILTIALLSLVSFGSTSAQQYRLVSAAPNVPDYQYQVSSARLSDDGNWVFYQSRFPDLNGVYLGSTKNIHGYNLTTGQTTFVSALPNSRRGTYATLLDVNADGRYVVFSGGTVPQPGARDTPAIYVRDVLVGTTTKISETADPYSDGSLSANGEVVTFTLPRHPVPGQLTSVWDLNVWNRSTGQVSLVNVPVRNLRNNEGNAGNAKVSADGRYVIFDSTFDSLVPNDFNRKIDVFRRDLLTNTTTMVSVNSSGTNSGNGESAMRYSNPGQLYLNSTSTISSDGRFVIFKSTSTDLVPGLMSWSGVFVRDMATETTTLISINSMNTSGITAELALISANGQFVSFIGDRNNYEFGHPVQPNVNSVYRRDLGLGQTGVTNLLYPNEPTRNFSSCFNSGISGDGRFEVFTAVRIDTGTGGANKVELYLVDHQAGSTIRLGSSSAAAQGAVSGDISRTGNTVVFLTRDSLVPEDIDGGFPDVYVYQIPPDATKAKR